MPNICNIQCTNVVSNICNTSPLKENFGNQGVTKFYKRFSPYIHTQVITFYKAYFSKYKSKIGTMYNLYKPTNYKYTNYTLNTVSGQRNLYRCSILRLISPVYILNCH